MMMFEVPEAKRIKRSAFLAANSDANSSDGSRHSSRQASPSSEEEHRPVEVDYGFEYDFVSPQQQDIAIPVSESRLEGNDEDEGQQNEEPTYQFRLFTQPTTTSGSTSRPLDSEPPAHPRHQAIRLSTSPEPGSTEYSLESARFIRPRRPDSYHFTSALPESSRLLRACQYEDMAISSHLVLSNASSKWPGTALPWRVITTTVPSTPKAGRKSLFSRAPKHPPTVPTSKAATRPRPSKKRRIHLRRRLAAKAAAEQQAMVTDAAEREKRTRRNREKKVKRKEREKRKKLEKGIGTTLADGGGGSGSGSDSD